MSPQRVHLDIQVGEHTNNYPEIAAKDKLTELQLRARQLLDQVEQIQKEQNYQRVRARPKTGLFFFRGWGLRPPNPPVSTRSTARSASA